MIAGMSRRNLDETGNVSVMIQSRFRPLGDKPTDSRVGIYAC